MNLHKAVRATLTISQPLATFGVKSLSPWRHIHSQNTSVSYYYKKKKKKTQLDENKHMLFVNLKQPAHLTKYHQCGDIFQHGLTQFITHLLLSWYFTRGALQTDFNHSKQNFYTGEYKT